jgi:hypothetical protein
LQQANTEIFNEETGILYRLLYPAKSSSTLAPADYTLTSTTLTLVAPVLQYDIIIITYLALLSP